MKAKYLMLSIVVSWMVSIIVLFVYIKKCNRVNAYEMW